MTKYRVKVRLLKWPGGGAWRAECPACHWRSLPYALSRHDRAMRAASEHASQCADLALMNWAAACPSCKLYGRVAKACPVCLGRGYEHEQEGLA